MSNYKRLDVRKLKPSELRLLLVSFGMAPGDTYLDLMKRSGIRDCEKFQAAHEHLEVLGFFYIDEGQVCPRLYVEEPIERKTEPVATMPYIGLLRATNAKQ